MNSDIEKKWQDLWNSEKIFEPKLDKNKKKFFITVPYPYANGPLHIGHGRAYTVGDVIARFKRAQGYNVLFPMAFHVSGTPILAISDMIKNKDPEIINLYMSYLRLYEKDEEKIKEILNDFTSPYNVAIYFAEKIQEDFKSLGLSIDWTRKFHTAEKQYNRFVEWQFKKLYSLNLIKKGDYPITFSIKDQNPVGEDDIKDGDTDKVSILEFTSIKFSFEDGYLLASTLRPETLFGVTNLWINPDSEYLKVRISDKLYFVSKEAFEKLEYQIENVKSIEKLKGTYFIDKTAKLDILDRTVPILPAEFVDPDNATGIVYSVPAHAPYDFIALRDLKQNEKYGLLNITPIKIIDLPNYKMLPAEEVCKKLNIKDQNDAKLEEATKIIYKDEFYNGILNEKCGQFKGLKISEIKDNVQRWLLETGNAILFYELSRKTETRGGNKVIASIVHGQWFIDYKDQKLKAIAHNLVSKMDIYPEKYKQQFNEVIDWLRERPCARKRGLGTNLPFEEGWVIESLSDSTIYMALYTIINYIREYNISPENLTYEFFESLFLDAEYDGALASELMQNIKESFKYWYPNDIRVTSTPHISNHLSFFIMNHAAIFPEIYWPKALGILGVLIREGAKMSKSKGNVVPLSSVSNKYSADLYRLYIVSTTDIDSEMDWKESEVEGLQRKFERFEELINESVEADKIKDLDSLDLWLLSRFYSKLKDANAKMSQYRFRDAVIDMFFNFLIDIKYYEKRKGKERRRKIIRNILEDWLISLSPVIPHICEEYWHKLGHEDFISLQLFPEPNNKLINKNIEYEVEYVESVLSDIMHILELLKNRSNTVYIYTLTEVRQQIVDLALKEDRKTLMSSLNNKEDLLFANKLYSSNILKSYIKIDEYRLLRDSREYLENEIGLKLVINGDYDPKNKKNYALPNKPSIYIE
ncbi:MAG: leucine--tRNA ligase [Thermoplasmata archaeon]